MYEPHGETHQYGQYGPHHRLAKACIPKDMAIREHAVSPKGKEDPCGGHGDAADRVEKDDKDE